MKNNNKPSPAASCGNKSSDRPPVKLPPLGVHRRDQRSNTTTPSSTNASSTTPSSTNASNTQGQGSASADVVMHDAEDHAPRSARTVAENFDETDHQFGNFKLDKKIVCVPKNSLYIAFS